MLLSVFADTCPLKFQTEIHFQAEGLLNILHYFTHLDVLRVLAGCPVPSLVVKMEILVFG